MKNTNKKDNNNNTNSGITFSSIANQQEVTITGEKGLDREYYCHWTEIATGETVKKLQGSHQEEIEVDGKKITRTKQGWYDKYSAIYNPSRVKIVFRGKMTDEQYDSLTKFHRPLEGSELVKMEEQCVLGTQERNPDKEITSKCTFKESLLYQVVDQEIDKKMQKYRHTTTTERYVAEDGTTKVRSVDFTYINLATLFQPTDEMPLEECISIFQD